MRHFFTIGFFIYFGACATLCQKPILEFPKGQCEPGGLTGWYNRPFMGVPEKCTGSICKYKEKIRDMLSFGQGVQPKAFTKAIFVRGPETQWSHPIFALKADRYPAKIFGKKIDQVSGTLAWEIHNPEYKGPPRFITIEFKDADVIEVNRVEYFSQCECIRCPPEFLERDEREKKENKSWW